MIGFHRDEDPELYDLYARKLPIRGWPGQMTAAEKAYRKEHRRRLSQMAPNALPEAIEKALKRQEVGLGR